MQRLTQELDNICILFATLFVFCVGQSLFWLFIGSKQYENIMKEKSKIAEIFFNDTNKQKIILKKELCKKLKKHAKKNMSDADTNDTNKENWEMMKSKFAPFLSFTFLCFLITLILALRAHMTKTNPDAVSSAKFNAFVAGLALVLLSLLTEIVIFIFIIKPYNIIGDLELIKLILLG